MDYYNGLVTFAAIVRAGSFTRAAAQLGVSRSALSHSVTTLERDVGLKLLNRTTRSVSPTEAGERLYQTIAPRFADIEAELVSLRAVRGQPAGTVRITASDHAVQTLIWPRLDALMAEFPDIRIEIDRDNRFTDIVANRFDIGVRLGNDVARDMIAVRIAPDMRMTVVGAPACFDRDGRPQTPQALLEHNCISMRLPTHGGLMAWEFQQDGHVLSVNVSGQFVANDASTILNAAVSGRGLAWLPDDMVRPHVEAGRLESVLDACAMVYPGYHLYYVSRGASRAISMVVDRLRYTPDAT
jgi:DNA-binding transcriptional LysR family regulator